MSIQRELRATAWRRTWTTGWAILTGLGLFFSLMEVALGSSWPAALRGQLLRFELWLPAVPLLLWISRRYWWTRNEWPRTLGIHCVIAPLASALHTLVYLPLNSLLAGRAILYPTSLRPALGSWLLGLFIFGVAATIIAAGDYRLRWQSEQLRAAQLEAQLARAELAALRMQLEPHFLFNTLNGIHTLILEEPVLARRMLVHLSDLLRSTLSASAEAKVSLAEELE